MTSNQDKTFKGLITQIIAVLSEDKRYLTFINHGQLEYNAFSITFWVNFEGLGVQNSVYIKIPKSCFCLKKIIFRSKFQPFFSLKCPKVRPLLEFLSQAVPKVQENKVFWINVNFSKKESALMSVDVSLR